MPERIQLRRSRGWRIPTGTVKVDRSGPFGNPFRIGDDARDSAHAVELFEEFLYSDGRAYLRPDGTPTEYPSDALLLTALGGQNLGCWCRIESPCHADVLLAYVEALGEPYEGDLA